MRYVKTDKGFLAKFAELTGGKNPSEPDVKEIEKIIDGLVKTTQPPQPAPTANPEPGSGGGGGSQGATVLGEVVETVLTAAVGETWVGEAITVGETLTPLVVQQLRRCRLFDGAGLGRRRVYVSDY
jgi:hypothetical protein